MRLKIHFEAEESRSGSNRMRDAAEMPKIIRSVRMVQSK